MNSHVEICCWVVLAGGLLAAGCASHETAPVPAVVCPNNVARTAVVEAVEDVLSRMHFAIEKRDAEEGIIRTRPLTGGQAFEIWRSDNVGAFNGAEANLQTIRRSVEVRVRDENGRACLDCNVRVERLSLPENAIASTSQGYRIHSQSSPLLQTFELTGRQQAGMAWIDLGDDPALAAEILRRIERKLEN